MELIELDPEWITTFIDEIELADHHGVATQLNAEDDD